MDGWPSVSGAGDTFTSDASGERRALGECVVGLKPRGSDHNLEQRRQRPRLAPDASGNERLPAVGKHDHVTRRIEGRELDAGG